MPSKSKTFKFITGSALAFALVAAGGASVNAATNNTTGTNPMSDLVTAIATKFNLNTADVQAVFDANHKQMEAKHSARESERLSAAVTAGKITQAQSDLITAKRAELEASWKAKRATPSTLTEAERKSAMNAERESLKTWMTTNNIPQEYMMMGGGHGKGGPHGGRVPPTAN